MGNVTIGNDEETMARQKGLGDLEQQVMDFLW